MQIDGALSAEFKLLGLSDYELRVFASASQSGSASAAILAKRAKIPRPSVYPVITALIEKGLLSIEKRKGMNIFIPSSPEKLIVLAEQKLETAKAGVLASKKIAAALRSTQTRDALTSAKILIFEGKKAVDQMLYERCEEWRRSTIQLKRPWLGFQDASFAQNYAHWIVDYWKKFNQYKDWQSDSVRLFSQEGAVEVKLPASAVELARGRREIKALPSGFPFSASLWVVGEYIVLLRTRTDPHYALQIRDQVLADNLAATFEFMWTLVPAPTLLKELRAHNNKE